MSDFESFGDFLLAVVDARPGINDGGLRWATATGANETVPHEGGFLVPTEFSADLLERTYDTGALLRRTNRFPMQYEQLRIPTVDESSRATGSRFGGLALQWMQAEGDELPASLPKFAARTLTVRKLAGIAWITGELYRDAPALEAVMTRLFTLEASFRIENEIVNGNGTAGPLGILNSNAVIEVAAVSGQGSATVLPQNFVDMAQRFWGPSHRNGLWLMSNDVFAQICDASFSNGSPTVTTGADGTRRILQMPVELVEYTAALGSRGDLLLCDLSEYLVGDRTNGLKADLSLHVRFLEDQGAFRFIWRTDGHPAWSSPLTPFNSTNTQSAFVTLAARS